jgi:hypothetical protein
MRVQMPVVLAIPNRYKAILSTVIEYYGKEYKMDF